MEGDPELACSWVIDEERSPPSTTASADQNILHPFLVRLKVKGKECLPSRHWLPLSFLISSHLCFYSVSFGGGDTPVSQTESPREWEVENVMVQASVRDGAKGLIVWLPSSRANLRRRTRPERWLRRNFAARLTCRLMACNG
jgi:hypothetical protein